MPKSDALSKEEIEKELGNHDIMNSGGVENQDIKQVNLEEKKNFHKENKIKDSCENSPWFSDSASNFPSLQSVGKSYKKCKGNPTKKLSSKASDSEDSFDKSINIFDDEETVIAKFILPFSIDDDAPPLLLPERQLRRMKNPYFVNKQENPSTALKRIVAHHDAWKTAYIKETRRMESNALLGDIEDSDSKEQNDSQKSLKTEEKENDPYTFASSSPIVSKVYSGPGQREKSKSNNISQQGGWQVQRKTSRDSDCEEVETSPKPDKPTMGEWITTNQFKSKRNRKQLSNKEKSKTYDNTPDLEFDLKNKWEPRSSTWNSAHSPSSSSLNNQVQPRRSLSSVSVVEEEKVQCPICQRNFALSKVENHAATCEGFSGSPMDIEEQD